MIEIRAKMRYTVGMKGTVKKNVNFVYVAEILKQFLLPFKKYIIVLIFTVVMSMALTVTKELMLKHTIDALVANYKDCFFWLGMLLASDVLMETCYRLYDKLSINQRPALKKSIVTSLMNKLLGHSYGFYQNRTSAQLSLCISNVCEGVEDLMTLIFDDFLQCFLIIIFTSITVFFNLNLTFALLFIGWGFIWVLAAWYWGSNMYMATKRLSDRQIHLTRNIADLMSEIFIVFSFHNQEHEKKNIEKWSNETVDAERDLRTMQYKIWLVQGFICALVHVLLIGYCVYLFSLGQATAGDLSFIFGTTATIYGKIWDLTKNVREFIETSGKVAQSMQMLDDSNNEMGENCRICRGDALNNCMNIDMHEELLDGSEDFDCLDNDDLSLDTNNDGAVKNILKKSMKKLGAKNDESVIICEKCNKGKILQIEKGEIVFDHVKFTYGGDGFSKPVFGGSDYIKIDGGSLVAIVGYSGSGKSTLIQLLMRLFEIQGGRIMIDGQNIHEVSIDSLRQNIAIVPQDAGLFMNRSIAENIAYGMYNELDERAMSSIMKAAKKAQAHSFIMELPDGYNTRLLSVGLNISIGQKQRLAIARGFLRDAAIFILDEATSALDNNTQLTIQDDLLEVVKGKTTIMIAHRLNTVQHADKILVFDQGVLIQEGSHDDLLKQDGCYKELWAAQK